MVQCVTTETSLIITFSFSFVMQINLVRTVISCSWCLIQFSHQIWVKQLETLIPALARWKLLEIQGYKTLHLLVYTMILDSHQSLLICWVDIAVCTLWSSMPDIMTVFLLVQKYVKFTLLSWSKFFSFVLNIVPKIIRGDWSRWSKADFVEGDVVDLWSHYINTIKTFWHLLPWKKSKLSIFEEYCAQ